MLYSKVNNKVVLLTITSLCQWAVKWYNLIMIIAVFYIFKKVPTFELVVILSNLNRFSNFCSAGKRMKFATKPTRHYPSQQSCVFWPNGWPRGFRYKVALYLSYLHIKFDDKTKGNPFEFQAYFPIFLRPKLNWRLRLALFAANFRSYWAVAALAPQVSQVILRSSRS